MVAMMRRRELEATKNPNHTKEENRYQNAWNGKEMHVPLAVMEEKLESRDKRKREGITFANEKGELEEAGYNLEMCLDALEKKKCGYS